MHDEDKQRVTDAELYGLFDRLLPNGFAGADVLAELAPEGWELSPLLACFHPSVERVFEERLVMHRNLEELRRIRLSKHSPAGSDDMPTPAPTLEAVRREYEPRPVQQDEELTDLIGSSLWDIFSDSHDVITADGRVADIGSFRGASAFLDEYLYRNRNDWREGDGMRFYMGTIFIHGRADLTPVYVLIFRRLKSLGANWVYHFPQMYLTELGEQDTGDNLARFRAELASINAHAREAALDRPPPPTVRAYRQVYGRDPRGWPPA